MTDQIDVTLLFARNPLDQPYTREELTAVVQHYREARQKILLGTPRPIKAAASAAPKKTHNLAVEI
jgi:hypothetical protein